MRNTRAVDVVKHLKEFGAEVTIHDPWADPTEVFHEYKLETVKSLPQEKFDAIVLAVAHDEFLNLDFSQIKSEKGVVYDVKGILGEKSDKKL